MAFKIQYTNPGETEKNDYMTYASPRGEFETAEAARAHIMEIRNGTYNTKRRFFVTEVVVTETVLEEIAPVFVEQPEHEPEFTVIDNRDMGIQGIV